MSSETRTLIVVLTIVGLLSCGCLCLPVGVALSLPAIIRVQRAVEQQVVRRAADERARQQARGAPSFPPTFRPPPPRLPAGGPTGLVPPAAPAPGLIPWVSEEPPSPGDNSERRSKRPTESAATGGLAALSELQRRHIYRSATLDRQIRDTLERQAADLRQRRIDDAGIKRMIADLDARHEQRLESLLRSNRITRDELNQIIAEGRDKKW
jgi:hypothetical protein